MEANSRPVKKRITPRIDGGKNLKIVATESLKKSPRTRTITPMMTSAPPVRAPKRTGPAMPPAPRPSDQILPGDLAQVNLRNSQTGRNLGKLIPEGGAGNQGDTHSKGQQDEHGRNPLP